jgi:hypothetical protein
MKYLCLVYNEEQALAAMDRSDYLALVGGHVAYGEELRQNGHLIATEALERVHTATTVRVRNGKVSTTDGPFAETKEQLGGFFLIEAKDPEEAIGLAAGIPSARTGCIEVRPIRDCHQLLAEGGVTPQEARAPRMALPSNRAPS